MLIKESHAQLLPESRNVYLRKTYSKATRSNLLGHVRSNTYLVVVLLKNLPQPESADLRMFAGRSSQFGYQKKNFKRSSFLAFL